MEALFNKNGQAVAFLAEGGRIISLRGQSVAWIREDGNVYNYTGQHQGRWKGDHMRGPDGGVMLWVRGANIGISLPLSSLSPLPPLPVLEPLRPLASLPPLEPLNTLGWSSYHLPGI